MKTNYQITAPRTPGSTPSLIAQGLTLPQARKAARDFSRDRRDLKSQDVRIERADGSRVEFGGPAR